MEPHRYQRKDDQDQTPKVRDSKPLAGEIKTILGGLKAGETLKSLKKAYKRDINSVHLWLPPMKMLKNDKLDIAFLEKDSCGIRQPHNDLLVIMLTIEEFNIHWVLIDNGSSTDIIYLVDETE